MFIEELETEQTCNKGKYILIKIFLGSESLTVREKEIERERERERERVREISSIEKSTTNLDLARDRQRRRKT